MMNVGGGGRVGGGRQRRTGDVFEVVKWELRGGFVLSQDINETPGTKVIRWDMKKDKDGLVEDEWPGEWRSVEGSGLLGLEVYTGDYPWGTHFLSFQVLLFSVAVRTSFHCGNCHSSIQIPKMVKFLTLKRLIGSDGEGGGTLRSMHKSSSNLSRPWRV